MFHHSTTLHHFSNDFTLPGKERRLANGVLSTIGKGMWSVTKGTAKIAGRAAKWTYYAAGGDFVREGTKKGVELTQKGMREVEATARTGIEVGKNTVGIPFDGVVETGVKAPLKIEKRLLIDNARHSLRTTFAFASAPFKSLGLMVRNLPKVLRDTGENIKNAFLLRGTELASSTRKTIGHILEPVSKPTGKFAHEAADYVRNIRDAIFKEPYEAIFERAPEKFRARWENIKNARATAKKKTEGYHKTKDELAEARKKRIEEKKGGGEDKEKKKKAA